MAAPAAPAPPAGNGKGHGKGNSAGHGNGNGNGNGNGHGGGKHAAAPSAPTSNYVASGGSTSTSGGGGGKVKGNGNGNHGNGNGKGNKQASGGSNGGGSNSGGGSSQPATSTPAPTPSSSNPNVHAAGANSRAKSRAAQVKSRAKARRTAAARRAARARARAHARATGTAGSGRRAAPVAPRALTAAAAGATVQTAQRTGNVDGGASKPKAKEHHHTKQAQQMAVVRTVEQVVKVIPGFIKWLIVVLGLGLVFTSIAYAFRARTARFLRRQREMLLGEIGVLQGALLPNVPAELSRLEASVAYRPAEGLAAGGDFYDAFPLGDGRVGVVVGDVAGHGKEALMHTALLRYTMRAYLEADMEPRIALQVAGRVLDRGFDTLATVVLAVYDPSKHILRYATAGHPPPVFLGEADHVPVTQASSPPIGAGLPTGLRQTTVCLPAGSAVCFFTDGLIEARRGDELIGRLGLVEIIRELGPHATASELLERVARDADHVTDDMAACMFRVSDNAGTFSSPRVEELEVRQGEPLEQTLGRFLAACGVSDERIDETLEAAGRTTRQFRGAVVRVSLPRGGARIEIRPANVETLTWAEARRAAV